VVMISPLSPVIANFFVEYLKKWLWRRRRRTTSPTSGSATSTTRSSFDAM
jgi:hypothetical protein